MIDLRVTVTNDGRDALVKFLSGITSSAKLLKFKFGEGGWTASANKTHWVTTGDGGASYSGSVRILPVVKSSFSLTDGTQTVTDDGSGNLTGDGSGSINYKTGAWSVTFNAAVASGVHIDATYQTWGALSEAKTQTIATGNGTPGPFFDVLKYRLRYAPIAAGSVTITDGASVPQTLTDTPASPYDGTGTLSGDGSGTIDYESGEVSFSFTNDVASGNTVSATYKYDGAPDAPDATLSDLVAVSDPDLYTFEKEFNVNLDDPPSGDIWIDKKYAYKVVAKMMLEAWEAIDDGNGDSPFFFEAGAFLEDGSMLAHMTFTKTKKTGASEVVINLEQVL